MGFFTESTSTETYEFKKTYGEGWQEKTGEPVINTEFIPRTIPAHVPYDGTAREEWVSTKLLDKENRPIMTADTGIGYKKETGAKLYEMTHIDVLSGHKHSLSMFLEKYGSIFDTKKYCPLDDTDSINIWKTYFPDSGRLACISVSSWPSDHESQELKSGYRVECEYGETVNDYGDLINTEKQRLYLTTGWDNPFEFDTLVGEEITHRNGTHLEYFKHRDTNRKDVTLHEYEFVSDKEASSAHTIDHECDAEGYPVKCFAGYFGENFLDDDETRREVCTIYNVHGRPEAQAVFSYDYRDRLTETSQIMTHEYGDHFLDTTRVYEMDGKFDFGGHGYKENSLSLTVDSKDEVKDSVESRKKIGRLKEAWQDEIEKGYVCETDNVLVYDSKYPMAAFAFKSPETGENYPAVVVNCENTIMVSFAESGMGEKAEETIRNALEKTFSHLYSVNVDTHAGSIASINIDEGPKKTKQFFVNAVMETEAAIGGEPKTIDDCRHLENMRSFVAESISEAWDRAESGLNVRKETKAQETANEIL